MDACTMPTIKTVITADELRELETWRKKLSKTKRAIVREALEDYFVKQKNYERGLDIMYVRSKYQRQIKLDLD